MKSLLQEDHGHEFEYNQVNTRSDRSTLIALEDNLLTLITDIQSIEIVNQALRLRISSILSGQPIKFDILVQPFHVELFTVDHYKNFPVKGRMIGCGHGKLTAVLIRQIKELTKSKYPAAMFSKSYVIQLTDITSDPIEKMVILHGQYKEHGSIKLSLQTEEFRLTLATQLNSLFNPNNYDPFPAS